MAAHIIGTPARDYAEWARTVPPEPSNPHIKLGQDAQHAECPFGCWHPQPFVYMGMMFCGRCWAVDRVFTLCVPCDEEFC